MARKDKKSLGKIKKIVYVMLLCFSAIAAVSFARMQPYPLLANQPKISELAIANTAQLNLLEFPIGWIDRVERLQTPDKVAQEGINFLIPYSHSNQQPTIMAYLDAAQKNGIKVFLEPYRQPVETGNAAEVTKFVKTYKNHPAVAGWYAYDEPATNDKVLPATLEITYQAIKAEDPKRPVAVVFAGSQIAKIPQYWNAMDICMVDRYPFFYNKPEFDNLSDFGAWMQKAAYYAGNKPFLPVLQAYGEQEDGKPQYNRRLPTAAEERYMMYTAINAGADGLIFYGHHWTQQSWINSVLTPLITEFKEYVPIVQAGLTEDNVLANQDKIQTVLYQDPSSSQKLLVAVHHGKGEVKAAINLESLTTNNKQVEVVGENRQLNLTTGTIQDTFDSYDVHIYEIS